MARHLGRARHNRGKGRAEALQSRLLQGNRCVPKSSRTDSSSHNQPFTSPSSGPTLWNLLHLPMSTGFIVNKQAGDQRRHRARRGNRSRAGSLEGYNVLQKQIKLFPHKCHQSLSKQLRLLCSLGKEGSGCHGEVGAHRVPTSLSPTNLALGTSPRSQPAADLVASAPTQVTHRRSPVLLTCRQQTSTPRRTHTGEAPARPS